MSRLPRKLLMGIVQSEWGAACGLYVGSILTLVIVATMVRLGLGML